MTIMKVDKYGFHVPVWPMACPPTHSQSEVLSVAVGNTHLTWTLHGSFEQEFIPCLFWRTAALSESDDDDIDGEDEESPTSTNKKLNDFLTESVREQLFGSADFTASSATLFRFTQKRIPYIYVYVVSTNPEHASSLISLFRDMPCILYRLAGKDFTQIPSLPPSVNEHARNDATPPIAMYAGIGVDRVANVVGATALFPKSKHVIVIDGGTAMTYTTIVRVPYTDDTNENKISHRLQMGGGIGPGLQMRFRSLFDYTADLPLVESSYVTKLLNECTESKKPLPLFTSSSVSKSNHEDIADDEDETVATKSIVGCVMTETALILCSIIQLLRHALVDDETLLAQAQQSRTGRASTDTTEAGGTSNGQKFLIRCEKRLQNYAISHVLSRHCIASVPTVTSSNGYKDFDVELLRKQLPGLRMARQNNKTIVFGTIVAVKRGIQFDNDKCIVMYDDDKKLFSLKIDEVYASFQLFLRTPEKFRTRDENVRIGQACRRKDVEEATALLLKVIPALQPQVESRQPAGEENDALELTVENFDETLATLKRKNMANAPKANKRTAATKPTEKVGKRVAKYFEIDGENGDKTMALFFGTVKKYVDDEKWWHIEYDDGDNEDMSVTELTTHLKLYEENKKSDTNSEHL